VSATGNGKFDEKTGFVTWLIDELPVGQAAIVELVVKVDADGEAVEIRNKASYAAPEDPQNIKEDEWIVTDEVIYQTVALHKDSSIKHGVDGTDAPYVKIGSTFTYIVSFDAMNPVYGLTVTDAIPKGLTYVEDSAAYAFGDAEAIKINGLETDKDNVLVFPTLEEVPAGTVTFTFDVKVNNVKEYDRDYFFINKATATVQDMEDSTEVIKLVSETVSHKTVKSNGTDTPTLGFTGSNGVLGWSMIAMASAAAMIAFGVYGFADKKKSKK